MLVNDIVIAAYGSLQSQLAKMDLDVIESNRTCRISDTSLLSTNIFSIF